MTPNVPTSDSGTVIDGNDGGPQMAQEDEDHHHHQADGQHQGELDIDHRIADRLRTVRHQLDVDRRRHRGEQPRHHGLDVVDHLDGVGAGLAEDQEKLAALAVEPGAVARRLGGVDDVGHVLQLDRRAVAVGDDDVAVARGMEQLVVGIDGDRLVLVLEVALGLVDRGVGQRIAHVLERDAVSGQRGRVGLRAHGEVLLAGHQHLGDAGDRRDLLRQDGVGVVVDLVDRQRVRRDRIDQDGAIGRVDLAVGRRVGQVLGQQPARRIDRRLHVGRRAVDAAAEIELQRDRGRAEATGRVHRGEAGDGGKLLLERRGDRRGHGLGAGAGQGRRHGDGREIDVGQRRDGQQVVGRRAEHQQAQHHQRRGDRPADEGFRDVHGAPLSRSCRWPPPERAERPCRS